MLFCHARQKQKATGWSPVEKGLEDCVSVAKSMLRPLGHAVLKGDEHTGSQGQQTETSGKIDLRNKNKKGLCPSGLRWTARNATQQSHSLAALLLVSRKSKQEQAKTPRTTRWPVTRDPPALPALGAQREDTEAATHSTEQEAPPAAEMKCVNTCDFNAAAAAIVRVRGMPE